MLQSIDTYLYSEIENKLKILLSNRYIIEEILKSVDPLASRNFIRAYAGERGKEIPLTYTMPQERVLHQGAIYIGLKEGQESRPSLGNLEGTYEFKEDFQRKEESEIIPYVLDGVVYCAFEVSQPIGHVYNVENISFSKDDNLSWHENFVLFKYDQSLLGFTSHVNYIAKVDMGKETEQGLKKGFTANETYSILPVSTNMDTVRCLDLVLRAIFIMMRSNPEEQTTLQLQSLTYGQIEEIRLSDDKDNPEFLYGREFVIAYTVSYSLDIPLQEKIEEIMINGIPRKEDNEDG